jgi:hypothetical protein
LQITSEPLSRCQWSLIITEDLFLLINLNYFPIPFVILKFLVVRNVCNCYNLCISSMSECLNGIGNRCNWSLQKLSIKSEIQFVERNSIIRIILFFVASKIVFSLCAWIEFFAVILELITNHCYDHYPLLAPANRFGFPNKKLIALP